MPENEKQKLLEEKAPYYKYKKVFSFRKFGFFLGLIYLSGQGEVLRGV